MTNRPPPASRVICTDSADANIAHTTYRLSRTKTILAHLGSTAATNHQHPVSLHVDPLAELREGPLSAQSPDRPPKVDEFVTDVCAHLFSKAHVVHTLYRIEAHMARTDSFHCAPLRNSALTLINLAINPIRLFAPVA